MRSSGSAWRRASASAAGKSRASARTPAESAADAYSPKSPILDNHPRCGTLEFGRVGALDRIRKGRSTLPEDASLRALMIRSRMDGGELNRSHSWEPAFKRLRESFASGPYSDTAIWKVVTCPSRPSNRPPGSVLESSRGTPLASAEAPQTGTSINTQKQHGCCV
jgi:hypothetical protein